MTTFNLVLAFLSASTLVLNLVFYDIVVRNSKNLVNLMRESIGLLRQEKNRIDDQHERMDKLLAEISKLANN